MVKKLDTGQYAQETILAPYTNFLFVEGEGIHEVLPVPAVLLKIIPSSEDGVFSLYNGDPGNGGELFFTAKMESFSSAIEFNVFTTNGLWIELDDDAAVLVIYDIADPV